MKSSSIACALTRSISVNIAAGSSPRLLILDPEKLARYETPAGL